MCGLITFDTFDGEVKAAQSISRQRVSATLEYHSTGLVHLHHFGHDLQDIQKQEIFKTQISLLMYVLTFSYTWKVYRLTGLKMAS